MTCCCCCCCNGGGQNYPIRGICYLLTAPSMWATVICVILIGLTTVCCFVGLLFAFALQPQAQAFGGKQWWSYILAVLAILFEAMLLSMLTLRVVHSKCQKKIFVQTMQLQGAWRQDEMTEPSLAKDINCCRIGFFVQLITFPLHLIPVAGTVLFSLINAPFEAWDLMDMYFDAIHMTHDEQFVELSNGERTYCSMYSTTNYMKFGFVAMLLESVPIAGPVVFSLTNACGAGLWAADMQLNGGPKTLIESEQVEKGQGSSKKVRSSR